MEIRGGREKPLIPLKVSNKNEMALTVNGEKRQFLGQIEAVRNQQGEILANQIKTVLSYEEGLIKETKTELRDRARQIQEKVRKGEYKFADVKLEYLAILREAAKRFYGMRAYNVQLASVLLLRSVLKPKRVV